MGNRDIDLGGGYTILQPEGMIAFEHASPVYADIDTFVVLAEWYAKDKDNIFHMDEKIEGCDLETFKLLGNGYAIDKNRAYILGKPFKTDFVDLETLIPIRPFGVYRAFYAKDKNIVFIADELIKDSDPESFSVLGCGLYAKDKNHVYYVGKEISSADVSSFVAFGNRTDSIFSLIEEYAKDKNQYYFKGEPIAEQDVPPKIKKEL